MLHISAGVILVIFGLLIVAFFYFGAMLGSETGEWPSWATGGVICGGLAMLGGVAIAVWG